MSKVLFLIYHIMIRKVRIIEFDFTGAVLIEIRAPVITFFHQWVVVNKPNSKKRSEQYIYQ